MKLIATAALLAAMNAGAQVKIDPEITFGTIVSGSTTIKLYDIMADCEMRGEGMAASKVMADGRSELGCWDTRDDLVYLRFRDGTRQVAPRSAIRLGPKYRKPPFSL